jgi:hypothetical protein
LLEETVRATTSEYDDLVAVVLFVVVVVRAFLVLELIVVVVVGLVVVAPLAWGHTPSLRGSSSGFRFPRQGGTTTRPAPAHHIDMPVAAAGQTDGTDPHQAAAGGQLRFRGHRSTESV